MRRAARSAGVTIATGLLLWLVLLMWALAIGRYGGPDEPAHVTRAAAVADGQVRGDPAPGMAGGFRVVRVPAPLASGDPSCYRHDPAVPATCAAASDAAGTAQVATSAGINPPLYYAMVGVPVRLLGHAADTTWYRLVATWWNALVLALVLGRARRHAGAPTIGVLVTIAAVTPAAWFLLGVVNPNGLEIALALLAWVSITPLVAERSVCERIRPPVAACLWVSVPAAVAISIRPIAVIAIAAMAVVLAIGTSWTRGWGWHRRAALLAPVGVAALGVAIWNATVRLAFDDPRLADHGSRVAALGTSLRGTPATLREMVGSASWLEYTMPVVSQLVWWVGAIGALVVGWRIGSARRRWMLLGWVAVLLLAPVAFEVIAAQRVGFIWQGRYSIPTAMGLAMFAIGARPGLRTIRVVAVALVVAELAAFWATLRRFTVGTSGPWWLVDLGPASWRPTIGPTVLLILHAACVALVGAAGVTLTRPTRTPAA